MLESPESLTDALERATREASFPDVVDADGSVAPTVLMVADAFPPDPLSGALRPGRFAKFLPEFGYNPVVVCRGEAGRSLERSDTVRRTSSIGASRKVRTMAKVGAVLQRYLLPYNDNLPWVAHALSEAEAVLASRPVSAVFSTSPPVATHLAALAIKLRYGLPWIADFRDPLWGNPFRARWWPFPYDRGVEGLIFRHADAVIANTDATAELWRGRRAGIDRKLEVIWNGYDPDDRVKALPVGERGRRVLAHVGSLYGHRHPGLLLSSLVRLIRRRDLNADDVCARFVGIAEENCIRKSQDAVDTLRGWGCLECDGKQVPMSEARRVAAQADYLLVLDLNEQGASLQVPAKLFEYIQIGRPILAFTQRDSPTDRVLKGSGVPCRIVYLDYCNEQIDHEVLSLLSLPSEPTRPSSWFEEQFDGRNQTHRLARILDALRDRRRSQSGSGRPSGAVGR